MVDISIFQHLVKDAPVGFVLIDVNMEVVFVNSFITERTGYGVEELLGEKFFILILQDQELRDYVKRKISGAEKKPFEDFQFDMQKKKGHAIPASLSCSSFLFDSQIYFACVILDTTNRATFEKVIEAGYDNLQRVTIDLETAMKKITEQQIILKAYKEKMTQELEIANSVQRAIIPTQFPSNEKLDIWGISVASEKLGGDYFDIFDLDEDVYGIAIADVAGHGVAASLLTTMLKAYFEYYTKHYREPEKVFSHINNSLASILGDSGFYFTALYCVLDFNTMEMTCCAAGHDPGICLHPGEKDASQLGMETRGLILGVFQDAVYKSTTFQLTPGCKIFLYTDGITEARSDSGDYFGFNRLVQFLQHYFEEKPDSDAKSCIDALFSVVNQFYGENSPNDDRTAVLINILG
jgi:PAS domain S-box-containing protein